MMKDVVDGVVRDSLDRYDAIKSRMVDHLEDIGTPRQLEGKVSDWTQEQHTKLQFLFHKEGETELCPYCTAVAEEKIANMKEAEQGEV